MTGVTDPVLQPTSVAAGGDAIARDAEGRVVFIEGALPGERVRAEITDQKRDFRRARAVDVVDAAADRVTPPCPFVAAGCGGCQWQHVAAAAQARLKVDIVIDALRRLARLSEPPVAPEAVAGPPEAYRTTLRLAVDRQGRAAYHRRHGHELVVVESCLIAHPRLEELVVDGRFHGARDVTLRVSAATGERIVLAHPKPGRLVLPPDVQSGGRIHEDVAGRSWRVSATSFFQAGPASAELLVAAVLDAVGNDLPDGGTVVDAYAGVGLLGGALAATRSDVTVVAIESHPAAARDARANLDATRANVLQIDVGDWEAPAAVPDVVVADPARPGLGRPGVRALAAAGAPILILASCDPASLARDASLLADAGYRLAHVQVLDLFPHTVHVETVSRFELVDDAPPEPEEAPARRERPVRRRRRAG
jgi:23S rRNA (uracil1939-C5)-methyltransferase